MTGLKAVEYRICARLSILLLVISVLPALTHAAAKHPNDASAVATISTAVSAMGFGAATLPITVRLTGSVSAAAASDDPAGSFVSLVELSQPEYQVRNEFTYATDGKVTVFVAGKKGAAFLLGKRVINMSAHMAMITGPSQMPVFELIRALSNSNYQISQAPPVQIGGVSAVHVKISDETDSLTHAVTPQDWYFDPNSGLPLRWEFRVPDAFNGNTRLVIAGAQEFSNYQAVNGMLLPTQATYFRDGQARSITTNSSVELNFQIPASAFDLPTGGN